MHIVHKKIKQLSRVETTARKKKNDHSDDPLKDVCYRFNMYSMSLLVNARTLYEFETILEDVAICSETNGYVAIGISASVWAN